MNTGNNINSVSLKPENNVINNKKRKFGELDVETGNVEKSENYEKKLKICENERGLESFDIEVCLERAEKEPASLTTWEVYELLSHYRYFNYDNKISKEKALDVFIEHFTKDKSRIQEKDAQHHNAFHWAVFLESFDTWRLLRDLLDKEADSVMCSVNRYKESPWDLVFSSNNHDFMGHVLLDENNRNPQSLAIEYLINQKNVTTFKDRTEFIFKFLEFKAVAAGNKNLFVEILEECYQTWKTQVKIKNRKTFLESRGCGKGPEEKNNKLIFLLDNPEVELTFVDEKTAPFLKKMRESYKIFQAQHTEDYQFGYFLRDKTFLNLLSIVLRNAPIDRVDSILKVNSLKQYSVKEVLEDPFADQCCVKDCILGIFKREDRYEMLAYLEYDAKDIFKLIERHHVDLQGWSCFAKAINVFIRSVVKEREVDGKWPEVRSRLSELLYMRNDVGQEFFYDSAVSGNLGKDIATVVEGVSAYGLRDSVFYVLEGSKYRNGRSPLFMSAQQGNLSKDIGIIIETFPARKRSLLEILEEVDLDGRTVLHESANKGHLGTDVNKLIEIMEKERLLKLLAKQTKQGIRPINISASRGYLGKDIGIMIEKTPLYTEDFLRLLEDVDRNGRTILCSSAYNGHLGKDVNKLVEIMGKERLLKLLEKEDVNLRTVLYLSAYNGHLGTDVSELVEIMGKERLLKLLNTNVFDTSFSPLHASAEKGHLVKDIKAIAVKLKLSAKESFKLLSLEHNVEFDRNVMAYLSIKCPKDFPDMITTMHTTLKFSKTQIKDCLMLQINKQIVFSRLISYGEDIGESISLIQESLLSLKSVGLTSLCVEKVLNRHNNIRQTYLHAIARKLKSNEQGVGLFSDHRQFLVENEILSEEQVNQLFEKKDRKKKTAWDILTA